MSKFALDNFIDMTALDINHIKEEQLNKMIIHWIQQKELQVIPYNDYLYIFLIKKGKVVYIKTKGNLLDEAPLEMHQLLTNMPIPKPIIAIRPMILKKVLSLLCITTDQELWCYSIETKPEDNWKLEKVM